MRRDAVLESFREALLRRDRVALSRAMQQGRKVCMVEEELAGMEQQFNDACVRDARQKLEQAFTVGNMNRIEEVIEQSSLLELEELREARKKLSSLRLLAAMRDVQAPFPKNIDALRRMMQRGVEHGVDGEVQADALAILSWAELNVQEHVCDICYEEVETDTMPC